MRTCFLLSFVLLLLPVLPVLADDEQPDAELVTALREFLVEDAPETRAAQGLLIASRWPDAAVVARALPHARTWSAEETKGDVVTWKRSTADGVEHTIFANIPEGYDPAKATPVLIWLHGGVSRPADGAGVSGIQGWSEVSDEDGFLLLSPSTQTGAEWWTPNGVALVRGALDDLKRRYHVDADRVAVSGFSDGASGCFHLLAHDPDPYACFLPLMAHPGVTRLGGGPCFAANVRSRPVFAVNGGQDPLYPSARIKPMIDELKAAGCDLEWTDLPEAGHRMTDVLPDLLPRMREFWQAHPREALPSEIAWETGVPEREGRFAWVEILAVDEQAPSAEGLEAAVLPDPAGRPRLGIRLAQDEYEGPGLKIGEVQPGTAAEEAGFEEGDVILAVDGKDLGAGGAALAALRAALDGLTDRDGVFKVQRGEETLEIETRPRVVEATGVERPKALGYGLPSGRIHATVSEGNVIQVRTRHVKRFKLHLALGMEGLDLEKPVQVLVNGKPRFEGVVVRDVGYALTEAVRSGPGAPAYVASVVVAP